MPKIQKLTEITEIILSTEEILSESWTQTSFISYFSENIFDIIEWCAKRKLINNSFICEKCNDSMSLIKSPKGIDMYRWNCPRCKATKSIRVNSIFDNSRLSLKSFLLVLLLWAKDYSQKSIAEEAHINKITTSKLTILLREICQEDFILQSQKIGGYDAKNNRIIVEIDETKFFHRKYHRGRYTDGQWCFGGVERNSRKCFIVPIADRRESTLLNCIFEWILPGTIIISDKWASYRNLMQHNDYQHFTVNHSLNFVNPENPEIHTNNIENLWHHCKRKLRRQYGTSSMLFEGYIFEFMWRMRYQNKKTIFGALIITINKCFPL
jgi:transposase-like protein